MPVDEQEIAAGIAALAVAFPTLSVSIPAFGTDIKLTLAEIAGVLNGQAVSVPVAPLKVPVLGKELTISLAANGVTAQIA